MTRSPYLCHRGSMEAAGYLIDVACVGEREARRRALALWEPGATVHVIGDTLLVRFASARRVRCDQTLGAPLAHRGGVWTTGPLDPVAARAGDLHRYVGGVAEVVRSTDMRSEDVASWLALDAYELLQGESLGSPATAPAPAAVTVATDTRALFQHAVGKAPAAGMREMVAAMERLQNGDDATAPLDGSQR